MGVGSASVGLAQGAKTGPAILAIEELKTSLDAIAVAWKSQTGRDAAIAYASSETIVSRIEQNATADVVAIPDDSAMQKFEKAGVLRKNIRATLADGLVLATLEGAGGPAAITPTANLATEIGDAKIAVCMRPSCRSGASAQDALTNLRAWDGVEPKLSRAETIGDTIALVVHGDARYALLYATEAKSEPKLKVVAAFPAAAYHPVRYQIAVFAASKDPDAVKFVSFLRSQAAVKIFAANGFTLPIR